eukprot:COSAG06_NODE_4754_length_3981_cov_2.955458_8_plen_69_part_00
MPSSALPAVDHGGRCRRAVLQTRRLLPSAERPWARADARSTARSGPCISGRAGANTLLSRRARYHGQL